MEISDKDYIEHHGVKGQKWGVRKDVYRRQNTKVGLTKSGNYRLTPTQAGVVGGTALLGGPLTAGIVYGVMKHHGNRLPHTIKKQELAINRTNKILAAHSYKKVVTSKTKSKSK